MVNGVGVDVASRATAMAPVGGAQPHAPGPTNVLILSKIPKGVSEAELASGAGLYSQVLQVSYRPADLDGPGWAIVAFASPELAKMACERLDGKPLPGAIGTSPAALHALDAALGDGLYGNLPTASEHNSPWKEARTPQGQVYYFHAVTRQTSWTKPPPDFLVPPPPMGMHPSMVGGARPPPYVVQPRPGLRPPMLGLLGVNQPPPPPGSPAATAQLAIQAAQQAAATAQSQLASDPASSAMLNAGPVGGNLFIYHIPSTWNDSILRQHFEHFGKLVSCRVQTDGDGRSRGFGFVSFDSAQGAGAAIAGMHGFPVDGKHLKVQLKKGDEQQMMPSGLGSAGMPGLMEAALPGQPPPPPGLPPGMRAVPPPRPGPY